MSKFRLPVGYVEHSEPTYFDDSQFLDSEIIHQPEVYDVADYILQSGSRTTIIDIGCGNGRKLRSIRANRHVGIDFGSNISICRQIFGHFGEWIEADLSREDCISLADLADEFAVVVCSDVVEHLLNPDHLIKLLVACYSRGAIIITSTPDRIRVRGAEHNGPPPNPAHIREWALAEYVEFLADNSLPATYAGYTFNNNISRELRTIITIHDIAVEQARIGGLRERPIAIVSAYNEADVIDEVINDLLDQDCDVVAIDNWSTDDTWKVLCDLSVRHDFRVMIEKFPAECPSEYYEWRQILRRKEIIAQKFPGRWIIHTDADEIRRSPFPDLTIGEALHVAQQLGANRVNFNLINFRPIDDQPFRSGALLTGFSHFEYGTRPGHFKQAKAWLQGTETVDLVSSGGHSASFSGAVDFCYKFLLRHYPIRSAEHGRRKVITDRQGRWSPEERSMGWHIQYDNFSEASSFLWRREDLHEFSPCFWHEHGLAIMTNIAERRVGITLT